MKGLRTLPASMMEHFIKILNDCRANQLTSFYMMATLAFNELKLKIEILEHVVIYVQS